MTMIRVEASTLAEMLGTTRRLRGASLRAMGEMMGVAHTTIAAWERGDTEPSFSQVLTWARLTGQPIEIFVEVANTETAPAEAEAVSGLSQHSVRPKGLEPLTFWSVVEPFWTPERLAELGTLSRQLDVDTVSPNTGTVR